MSCALHLLRSRGRLHAGRLLLGSRRRAAVRRLASAPPISRSVQQSFRLLQLPDEALSSPAQVREAYLRLAKLYHPDSGAATADAALFARVEEAYRAVLAHQSKTRPGADEDEDEDKSRGGSLQHRHYLSYDGVGTGTPSQRERQYRQIRVDRANEQVLDYRQREHERAGAAEGALVERDVRQRSRKIKITQAVERLVEDLIQEAIARGDFSNLSSAGKPLSRDQDHLHLDPSTYNLNRILIDNGYKPPWVVTQGDIHEAAGHLRQRLLEGRARLSDPASPQELLQWEQLCASAQEDVDKLNKLVGNYNLTVPLLQMQMVYFSVQREAERAERGARQRRLEVQQQREEERRRRKEEKKKVDMAAAAAGAAARRSRKPVGFMSWVQKLLQVKG